MKNYIKNSKNVHLCCSLILSSDIHIHSIILVIILIVYRTLDKDNITPREHPSGNLNTRLNGLGEKEQTHKIMAHACLYAPNFVHVPVALVSYLTHCSATQRQR